PGFYIASMAFAPTPRGSALPRPTPSGGLSNDAAGFASCYGPHRRSPYRAFDAGLRPRPFPDKPASLLPGLLAATRTSTGKRRRAYEQDPPLPHGFTSCSAGRTESAQ